MAGKYTTKVWDKESRLNQYFITWVAVPMEVYLEELELVAEEEGCEEGISEASYWAKHPDAIESNAIELLREGILPPQKAYPGQECHSLDDVVELVAQRLDYSLAWFYSQIDPKAWVECAAWMGKASAYHQFLGKLSEMEDESGLKELVEEILSKRYRGTYAGDTKSKFMAGRNFALTAMSSRIRKILTTEEVES